MFQVLFVSRYFLHVAAQDVPSYRGPDNAALDAAREWLWANPPDFHNTAERRRRMAVIQAAADLFPHTDAELYLMRWVADPAGADAMERQGLLYYLKRALDYAVEDIKRTRVERGVVIWHLYNMGYVFKTPDACFGIDIWLRNGERLVRDLDFLLITHEHVDHHMGGLGPAMIRAGKPVVSRFMDGSRLIREPAELRFGSVRVKIDIGDHTPANADGCSNMLMFQVDCAPAANNFVIYHSGDGANYDKMTPDKPVDIYIPHVACNNMSVAEAIRHIHPKLALVSHVMELTHEIGGCRWSYDYAFNAIKDLPEAQATILTWGERLAFPK